MEGEIRNSSNASEDGQIRQVRLVATTKCFAANFRSPGLERIELICYPILHILQYYYNIVAILLHYIECCRKFDVIWSFSLWATFLEIREL